ncbi:MAG: hypothetical protein ABID45_01915, partial [Patescibacteria group bacterium]
AIKEIEQKKGSSIKFQVATPTLEFWTIEPYLKDDQINEVWEKIYTPGERLLERANNYFNRDFVTILDLETAVSNFNSYANPDGGFQMNPDCATDTFEVTTQGIEYTVHVSVDMEKGIGEATLSKIEPELTPYDQKLGAPKARDGADLAFTVEDGSTASIEQIKAVIDTFNASYNYNGLDPDADFSPSKITTKYVIPLNDGKRAIINVIIDAEKNVGHAKIVSIANPSL